MAGYRVVKAAVLIVLAWMTVAGFVAHEAKVVSAHVSATVMGALDAH